jgi:hypothetical protein
MKQVVTKVVKGPRMSGKTTNLIRESSETGYTIVCYVGLENNILTKAKELGLDIPNPIPHVEFVKSTYYGKDGITGFLIDDADVMIRRMTEYPIKTITVSEYPTELI